MENELFDQDAPNAPLVCFAYAGHLENFGNENLPCTGGVKYKRVLMPGTEDADGKPEYQNLCGIHGRFACEIKTDLKRAWTEIPTFHKS